LLDIYQWMADHGGAAELLVDWAHGRTCGNGGNFSDSCLGVTGRMSFYNAVNYLLLNATYDIVRYVVNEEPFTPVQTSATSVMSGSIMVSPNPLSKTATITVHPVLGADKSVFVKIYDSKGRVVKLFQNSPQGPSRTYVFDASQCTPGIYFVKAYFAGHVMSKKLAVIR